MSKIRFESHVQSIKYDVLSEITKYTYEGTLLENLSKIPKTICPGPKPKIRCCVYKERAILDERIMLAISGVHKGENVISVIGIACDECPADGYTVTSDCRGCLSHRCKIVCPQNAIYFDSKMKATIDKTKCINCGLCAEACPFSAIQSRKRPCTSACKADAISTGEDMSANIDDERCIACGACVYQCPFGAITDRSSIVQIIGELKKPDNHTYAIIAPSVVTQFDNATIGQIVTGLKRLGFSEVLETALGADMVVYKEAEELYEKGVLTSSCCPAFVNYIKASFPDLADKISSTPSPMTTLANYIKSIDNEAVVVFIGPCTAKKQEVAETENGADFAMTVEELEAVFNGYGVIPAELEETPLDNASYFGRALATTGGLARAVGEAIYEREIDFDFKPESCEGLDSIRIALLKLSRGKADFNFLEGMACLSGCLGGPCNIVHENRSKIKLERFAKSASEKTIKSSLDKLQ